MKKLMVMLAAVALAACSQAATVDWTVNGTVFDWNTWSAPEGSISFYLASDTSTPLSGSPLVFDADGAFTGTVTGTDQTDWIARITINNFDGGGSYYKDYQFTMDTVTHAGYADAATYLTGLSGEISNAFGETLDLSASPASQGFTAAGVPEPTSGLLLLLGVAGLALKRKRA